MILISVDDLNSVNNMAKIGFSDNKEDKGKWLDPEITGYAPFNYQIQPNKDNRITDLTKPIWFVSNSGCGKSINE